MSVIKCFPVVCALALLLSGCSDTSSELLTTTTTTSMEARVETSTTVTATATTTTTTTIAASRLKLILKQNVSRGFFESNLAAYEESSKMFVNTLGRGGYAACPVGQGCAVRAPPPGLDSVDDVAVADGLIFLSSSVSRRIAVVSPNGTLLQDAMSVRGGSHISAAGGRVVVTTGANNPNVEQFEYSNAGKLQKVGPDLSLSSSDFGSAIDDLDNVHQPTRDIAFITTSAFGPIPVTSASKDNFAISFFNLTALQEFDFNSRRVDRDRSTPSFVLSRFDVGDEGIVNRRADLPIVPRSYRNASSQELCLVVISSFGLEVVCNPETLALSESRRARVSDARNLEVKGNRAFVITNDAERVRLLTWDLQPIDSGNVPRLLSTLCIASNRGGCLVDGALSRRASFGLASSSDGSKVFVSIPSFSTSVDDLSPGTAFEFDVAL